VLNLRVLEFHMLQAMGFDANMHAASLLRRTRYAPEFAHMHAVAGNSFGLPETWSIAECDTCTSKRFLKCLVSSVLAAPPDIPKINSHLQK
jgi:hypothetical protein